LKHYPNTFAGQRYKLNVLDGVSTHIWSTAVNIGENYPVSTRRVFPALEIQTGHILPVFQGQFDQVSFPDCWKCRISNQVIFKGEINIGNLWTTEKEEITVRSIETVFNRAIRVPSPCLGGDKFPLFPLIIFVCNPGKRTRNSSTFSKFIFNVITRR